MLDNEPFVRGFVSLGAAGHQFLCVSGAVQCGRVVFLVQRGG